MRGQRPPDELEDNRIAGPEGTWNGAFVVRHGSATMRILSSDGMGWDHVSVSLKTRCPTWDEMCWVKAKFFDDEETVMQLHPPKSQWINNYPFCLHLWRPQTAEEMNAMREQWAEEWDESWTPPPPIPLPPGIMVGIQSVGVLPGVTR